MAGSHHPKLFAGPLANPWKAALLNGGRGRTPSSGHAPTQRDAWRILDGSPFLCVTRRPPKLDRSNGQMFNVSKIKVLRRLSCAITERAGGEALFSERTPMIDPDLEGPRRPARRTSRPRLQLVAPYRIHPLLDDPVVATRFKAAVRLRQAERKHEMRLTRPSAPPSIAREEISAPMRLAKFLIGRLRAGFSAYALSPPGEIARRQLRRGKRTAIGATRRPRPPTSSIEKADVRWRSSDSRMRPPSSAESGRALSLRSRASARSASSNSTRCSAGTAPTRRICRPRSSSGCGAKKRRLDERRPWGVSLSAPAAREPPLFATPFGHTSREARNAPDAGELVEDVILTMIERSKRLEVDTGDVASLLALELIATLAAYNRAPLPVIMAAIAAAAPTRELLLRDANRLGQRPPPLNVAKLTAIAPDACRLH